MPTGLPTTVALRTAQRAARSDGRTMVGALAAAVLTSSAVVLVCASPASAATLAIQRPAMIAAGFASTVALTPAGTVRAWGDNSVGELGDGTYDTRTAPVSVVAPTGSGLLDHVTAVADGYVTSFALRSDGTVVSWGDGQYDALGNGSTQSTARPVSVVSTSGSGRLTGVVAIDSGGDQTLAARSDGTVVAWGENERGELGDGTYSPSPIPVAVHGPRGGLLQHVVSVAAASGAVTNDECSYALTSAGTVYAWGAGTDGGLGDGSTADSATPVQVVGVGGKGVLTHVVGIAGGAGYALALRSDGSVVAWGNDGDGQLGDGQTGSQTSVPVNVPALGHRVVSVAAGGFSYSSFAVASDGALYAWGDNSVGQLGDGTATDRPTPVQVADLGAGSGVVQATTGGEGFSAAVTGSGAVYDWGYDSDHELGDGSTVSAAIPVRPAALSAIGLPRLFLRVAPVLGGHARVGYTVTVTAGTWGLPATGHGYQWLRDGRAITHATASRYRLTSGDRGHHISVRVAASRAGYPGNSTVTRSVLVGK